MPTKDGNPTDREFLKWIHERLAMPNREGDHDLVSHQHRLRSIIARIPADAYTPTNHEDDEAVLAELDANVMVWLEAMMKTQPTKWQPVSNNPRIMRLWNELKRKQKQAPEPVNMHASNLESALIMAIETQRGLKGLGATPATRPWWPAGLKTLKLSRRAPRSTSFPRPTRNQHARYFEV